MKTTKNFFCFSLLSIFIFLTRVLSPLWGQTIAEKKASFTQNSNDLHPEMQEYLREINHELKEQQSQLRDLYAEVEKLYSMNAPEEAYHKLLTQINTLRKSIQDAQKGWQQLSAEMAATEGYSLWHQPDTNIGQLVIDYGSQNYVYLLSPEIATVKLSVDSNLPIPRASWDEMLELILVQNGIGFKQLNAYLRQLYFLKQDRSNLKMITNKREELDLLPAEARVLFMLSPEAAEIKRVWHFLDKFINPTTTVLQLIGRDILVVAPKIDLQELLKLYDFISANRGDKEYKLIPLKRIAAEEMSKVLSAVFEQLSGTSPSLGKISERNEKTSAHLDLARVANNFSSENNSSTVEANSLRIIPLSNLTPALFLYGTNEEIKRAEKIICEVESHMGGVSEKVIHWYTTRHSDPLKLADILLKVYALMVQQRPGMRTDNQAFSESSSPELAASSNGKKELNNGSPFNAFEGGYYLNDRYIVNPDPYEENNRAIDPNGGRTNFIVDPKTGAIVMVVEAELLPKLKELIRKLDIPKKMVQIEILLFEKRISNQDNIGLNLLKIGSDALNAHATGLDYNVNFFQPLVNKILPDNRGITTFFMNRKKSSRIPAYDAVYQFLISQEDISINASPSVLTLNQTQAHIAIEDEITVNTGVIITPVTNTTALNNTFARARYGIRIDITPIIHTSHEGLGGEPNSNFDDHEEEGDSITLQTDLVFETINGGLNPSQPDVTRRVINNEVRIPDGQTVILGGLRRKITDDAKDSIPFLGEIPGLGKLFSSTAMTDNSVEMFICITPKIVADPKEDLELYRYRELTRRPGDIPSFLYALEEAKNAEKDRLLRGTVQLLFGREQERCEPLPLGEYDGR
ncbi:hypothetical protein DB42_AK00110 [Neochlamydia sp. EPS4]|uniref:type II secretion system protein GspD n=1 Tax=unclassified Neochlamydia TaxID=2643326 RepID=UPI0005806253|nr:MULTISPECIES: type II secretion system protein GspD [unclassified Neochlamydia]KIC73261.1 hypothetical protein DB41_JM00140 [Neochlamydia sp. TUME1]KIC75211.1 hypothetical protein DB42_AK00110 [Neochlamydia sp. EPS4]